jgi:hypothetical protein
VLAVRTMVVEVFRPLGIALLAGVCVGLGLPAFSVAQVPRTWTVYSSLPMDGGQRFESVVTMHGIQLALGEAGGMAGTHRLRYVPLNDATSFARAWPRRSGRSAATSA